MPTPTHIFHLAVGGSETHRFCTLIAAEVAASKGWQVANMADWSQSDYRPDLVITKKDKYLAGPKRRDGKVTFWLDIVSSHDPRREWKAKGLPCDDVLIVDISKCHSLDECVEAIRRYVP